MNIEQAYWLRRAQDIGVLLVSGDEDEATDAKTDEDDSADEMEA